MQNLFTDRFSYYKEKSGIYQLIIGSKIYIGSSKDIASRLSKHKSNLKHNKHDNKHVQNCFNKYGKEKCFFLILELCTEEERYIKEQYYVDLLNPELNIITEISQNPIIPIGYRANEKKVYRYSLEGIFIDEFISAREAGRVLNFPSRGISQAANLLDKNVNSCEGYMFSYERKDKLDPYINNSSKAKIKAVTMYDLEGNKLNRFESIAEAARYIQEEHDNFDVLCACISSVAIGKGVRVKNKYRFSYEDKNNLSKIVEKKNFPIIQIQNGKETLWNSTMAASKFLNISCLGIRRVLRGERKSYKNSFWKFMV